VLRSILVNVGEESERGDASFPRIAPAASPTKTGDLDFPSRAGPPLDLLGEASLCRECRAAAAPPGATSLASKITRLSPMCSAPVALYGAVRIAKGVATSNARTPHSSFPRTVASSP